jgi:hypothetical protein
MLTKLSHLPPVASLTIELGGLEVLKPNRLHPLG